MTVTKRGEVVLQKQILTSYGDEPLYTAYNAIGDQTVIAELGRQLNLAYGDPSGELNLRAGGRWEASAGDYRVVVTG